MAAPAARPPPVRRLALSFAAGLVALFVAELSLRIAGLGDPLSGDDLFVRWEPTSPFFGDPDWEIGYTLEPGYRGEEVYHRAADGAVVHRAPVTVSSEGLRGRGLADEPPEAGATVVLGVGDSLTFGAGVADDETYLAELERRLRRRGAARVLNAGVPAWNLAQEVRWIESRAGAIDPDVLLLGFYVNDLDGPTPFLGGDFDEHKSLPLDAPPWTRREAGLRARSHLINLIARWRDRHQLARLVLEGHRDHRDQLRARFADERGARLLNEYFDRLADYCESSGTRGVVVLFPLMDTVHQDPLADVLDVARLAAMDRGLEVIDVTPALQDVPLRRLHVLPAETHPSPAAHAAVGRYLDEALGLNVDR